MTIFIFQVRVAFVELYKEDLCDLLCTKGDGMVDIREHPDQVGMATFPGFLY